MNFDAFSYEILFQKFNVVRNIIAFFELDVAEALLLIEPNDLTGITKILIVAQKFLVVIARILDANGGTAGEREAASLERDLAIALLLLANFELNDHLGVE